MNPEICACGKLRGLLNKTNWMRHLSSCKKRKLCSNNSIVKFLKFTRIASVESELEINDNAYDKTDPMLHIDHDPSLSTAHSLKITPKKSGANTDLNLLLPIHSFVSSE
ncbi:uncharacterized protein LOC112688586 [Sipha flava]|uniref:Uncharacterized protein LOC112688586 n=1 Tax=Sipha flava TaxID=143950 RepID=A0A2S2Q9J1_9HEMI|nr:uncharacterized protein LOC112688586 [Sipha flava]